MFPAKIKMCTKTLLITTLLVFVNGQDRKITSQNHPGCHQCTDDDVLIYTRAVGSKDTIHQIWDFTAGVPTVIIAVAGVNSTLDIDWYNTTPRFFNMSETPKYTFATAFDVLIEYNDVNDTGHFEKDSDRAELPLAVVEWRLVEDERTEDEAMVRVRGNVARADRNGTIDVRLDYLPFEDYAPHLPHLIHTANSTLVDVSLADLPTSRRWNSSRFALRTVVVATDASNDTMQCGMRKSLDDEHTPGVFEIIEIKSPESVRAGDGGFLQFRPVAYTQRERNVETSTVVRVADLERAYIHTKTLHTFFRGYDKNRLLVQDTVVSFGETGDGFYKKHNFTSWSLTVGYGAPPLESFSPLVLGVIAGGAGATLALAALGAAYACVRRREHTGGHSRLAEE